MKALIFIVVTTALFFKPSNGNEDTIPQRSPSQIVMESVPKEDRAYFVTYHISRAMIERNRDDVKFLPSPNPISEEKSEVFGNIPVPRNFSTNLLDWTELELVPSKTESAQAMQSLNMENSNLEICFPVGCFDPNDAGSLCCPF